jgi:SAM-dependent methyltransferase
MLPSDIAVEDVHAWLAPLLAGRGRVLEVGCGAGELARRLGAGGLQVTGIDVKLDGPAPAHGVQWVQADFLDFEDRPFDAVLFTRSLHHIDPLDAAMERAARLIAPGGLLVLDEFDRLAADLVTARWYYELQEVLAAAGIYSHDHPRGIPGDPAEAWRAEHDHDPPLHTGDQMLAAVDRCFSRLETERRPYLYRTIAHRLEASDSGGEVARHARDDEAQQVAAGELRPVGLRVVARAS